ncbi:FIG004655: Polysaccharide deacetylase [hydrothermal vent metagenome]|uniref:FIG004655: Polysaccharide deacetylase n=1 Tax=hydrothermal vent metagenome TaxID=652676 RepID=A0A3B0YBK5_9ZZZZ
MKISNALTIDVEDYFHVAALSNSISVNDWDKQVCRVEKNTHILLDLFDQQSASATFFILGWVAERHPQLVKEIEKRGHEVASHGYSHQLIYKQTPKTFKDETLLSKKILEDLTGKAVNGYRAASYSITNKSLWALDILADAGFKYDSSIFPVHHDNYGIPGSPTEPHVLKTPDGHDLIEFPLSTYKLMGQTLPVAGGGYFRLYPYQLSRFFYNSINKKSKPFVFYLHPWEVDPGQPRVKASWFSEFRHYNNLHKCESRLKKLLADFSFTTMENVLKNKLLIA